MEDRTDNKKILILYTSIGLGHKTIAENIGFYLEQDGYQVELKDAHQVQSGFLATWGTKLHHTLIKWLPFIWDWLYKTEWFINLSLPLRIKVGAKNNKKVLDYINEYKPDVVISTHNTASAILASLKREGLYSGKFGIAFSDFHLHKYWLFEQADFYLANIDEQKELMVNFGVPADKIFVCGMSVKFGIKNDELGIREQQVRSNLHIPVDGKIILFSSGSQGVGLDFNLLKKLSTLQNTTVLVACGKDSDLKKRVEKIFKDTNAKALGYYSPMSDLYSVSDIYITKAGGLSVAEALMWKLPILVFYTLPGGEIYNYQYLLKNKLVMPESKNILESITNELETGNFKKSLSSNEAISKILSNGADVLKAVKQA